jgi:eukaryotic-like serine/threonine-protein kinase
VVTLKKLRGFAGADSNLRYSEYRYELTKEFEILTSLRHPHIISVLEFGFDTDSVPFLTMELEENCRGIIEAAAELAESLQIDLLVQVLRALAYLHDCGVLHRDLSPANVVATDTHAKVLDFGFAVPRDVGQQLATVGTLRYMAPELLHGGRSTVESDLYSFGMIAYELLNGAYPFLETDKFRLYESIVRIQLPRDGDLRRSRLRSVVARLLQHDPANRFHSAGEVIEAIGEALGDPIPLDTLATRESFLQAAPFVGRKKEIETLERARRRAADGLGSSWIVGGESGVGKTRLLGELRRRALVDGMLVVRGEAVREGGRPYHLWRNVTRELLLTCELRNATRSILKSLVPDISELIGGDVPDAPKVDPEATQTRLFMAVEELIRAQRLPVSILLEDLHWVGSESLALFARVAESCADRRVLLIGTFRNDESPDLYLEAPTANLLTLRRLNFSEMSALGESMIGPAARRPEVIDLLQRESEGIPFFLVEVVRELAERSGSRGGIGAIDLPDRVVTGGIQRSVRRRLERVDTATVNILRSAAVIGRTVDRALIEALHPEIDFMSWAARCNRAALFDMDHQSWRFSHDKVREQVLDDLEPVDKRRLHARVAEILERDEGKTGDLAPRLAHHWAQAENDGKEAYYSEIAGRVALESGACREALRYLDRARELVRAFVTKQAPDRTARRRIGLRARLDLNSTVVVGSDGFRLGCIEGDISEAHYRLGDLSACRQHAETALRNFGQYVPEGNLDWQLAVLRQWMLRIAQSVLRVRAPRTQETLLVASAVARVQSKITDACFYSLSSVPLFWSTIRLINQCEPVGASAELARGYIILALVAGLLGLGWLEKRFARRALEVAEEVGSDQVVSWVLSRNCVLYQNTCRWAEFDVDMARATALAAKVGDVKLLEECRAQSGAVDMYRGDYECALETFAEIVGMGSRSGNCQVVCWVSLGRADCLCWLGYPLEARQVYEEVLGDLDEEGLKTEAIWAWGSYARVLLRLGDHDAAFDAAMRGLELERSSRPLGYWTKPGYAGTAEVLLRLWEVDRTPRVNGDRRLADYADEAGRALASFAKRFPLGRPAHLTWKGLRLWLRGRRRSAVRSWKEAVEQATALDTPYELAEAHAELARHLDGETGEKHREEATRIFARLGCAGSAGGDWTQSRGARSGVC